MFDYKTKFRENIFEIQFSIKLKFYQIGYQK